MKVIRTIWWRLFLAICLITVLALIIFDKGFVRQPFFSLPATGVASIGFVTRSGSQLMLDGHPFRFAGANLHWLGLDDSTTYPSQFRVDDGLDVAHRIEHRHRVAGRSLPQGRAGKGCPPQRRLSPGERAVARRGAQLPSPARTSLRSRVQ